jgi:Raf kinase inhibitor-like YbhB/YbcL family protein
MKPSVKCLKRLVKHGFILTTFVLPVAATLSARQVWAQDSPGFTITSPAFATNEPIPQQYTCRNSDAGSPPLSWRGVPADARTLALIVKDPDAPRRTFIHWVIYNIPATATGLEASVPPTAKLANGAMQGANTLGKIGYMGPCPPPGPAHHYHFYLMALDTKLDLQPGSTAEEVEAASRRHVRGEAELVGTFAR